MDAIKPIAEDEGCWIDGHWGQYGIARLIDIAETYGFADAEAVELAHRHLAEMGPGTPGNVNLFDGEFEILVDCGDAAEAFLNSVAPEGYSFGWFDGEFYLWATAEWEAAS